MVHGIMSWDDPDYHNTEGNGAPFQKICKLLIKYYMFILIFMEARINTVQVLLIPFPPTLS